MGVLGEFIGELVAGAARSSTGGVASLGHETGDNAVEGRTIIKALPGQEDEIVHRYGDISGEQLQPEASLLCFNGGGVFLGFINDHRGWC